MKKLKNTNIKLLRILFWLIILFAFIRIFDIHKTFQILLIAAVLTVIEIIRFVSAKLLINKRIKRWWKDYNTYCPIKYHKHKILGNYIIIAFQVSENDKEYAVFVWDNDEAGKYRLDWHKEYASNGWRNPRNKRDIRIYLDGWDIDTIKEAFKKIKTWFEDLDLAYRIKNAWDNIRDFFSNIFDRMKFDNWNPKAMAIIYTIVWAILLFGVVALNNRDLENLENISVFYIIIFLITHPFLVGIYYYILKWIRDR